MKKRIIKMFIFLLVILALVAGAIILAKQMKEEDKARASNMVSSYLDRAEFLWDTSKKVEIKNMVVPIDAQSESVWLHVGDGKSYRIKIPGSVKYLTDYSTYIYGEDNSYSVSVVAGVNTSDLSSGLSIKNAETLSPMLICAENTGKKLPQEAACIIYDDVAILIRAYGNPTAFYTMLDSIKTEKVKEVKSVRLSSDEWTNTVDHYGNLPMPEGDYNTTVNWDLSSAGTKVYSYDDGFLNVSTEMRKYEDSVLLMEQKVATATSFNNLVYGTINRSDNSIYYEVGGLTACCIYDTSNTTITLFGYGKEARYNILGYYRKVQAGK